VQNLKTLDGIRAWAAILIAGFHGICWIIMLIRDGEKLNMGGQWFASSLLVIVDLFFVLTGLLAALPLVKKGDAPRDPSSACSCLELFGLRLAPLRRKFWRITPPYFTIIAIAAVAFAGDKTWPRAYTRSEGLHRIDELFGPGNDWQGTSLEALWANLVHMNSLTAYAGFLIHTWSLGLQYLFWLTLPSLWSVLGLGRGNRLPALVAVIGVAHAAFRLAMWAKLRTFGGATDLSGFLHFSFYTAFGARMLALWLGVLIAWALHRAPALLRRLRGGSAAAWAVRLGGPACLAVVLAGNTLWENSLGHPEEYGGWHQAVFYVMAKPGGVLSCLGFAWIVLAAVIDSPLLVPAAAATEPEGAPPASSLTSCLSARWLRPISSASYWLYLLHPIVFAIGMSAPHFLMPASEARLPVPTGYGLGVLRPAMRLENWRDPLSPWQRPPVSLTVNDTAAFGWRTHEQDHWLMRHAQSLGLEQGPRMGTWGLAASGWAVVVLGVAASYILALALQLLVEPAGQAAMKALWQVPGVAWAADALVDTYNIALFLALPAMHIFAHGIWFVMVGPDMEGALLGKVKSDALNNSIASMAQRAAAELRVRGPRHLA